MIRAPWRVSGTERGTERIEAFSDGVFAIAITLLILEVKLPTLAHIHLAQSVEKLWPAYFAYAVSFISIGIYWANHHYLFKLFKQTDHMLNLLNLLMLMFVSFLPLPTAVLGNYMLDPDNRNFAVIFYTVGLLLPAIGWFMLWLYASNKRTIIDERLDPAFLRQLGLQYFSSIVVYTVGIVAAFFWANVGLGICIALTLLYLLPPKQPQYVGGAYSKI